MPRVSQLGIVLPPSPLPPREGEQERTLAPPSLRGSASARGKAPARRASAAGSRAGGLGLLILCLLLRPAACTPPSAAVLYSRSLKADDRFSYRGRQITTDWRTGRAVAVIVSHRAPNLRRLDVLAPERERGRSLVSNEREEWQFDPRPGTLLRRRLAPDAEETEDAAARYGLLKTNYVLAVLPDARTYADRKAFVVTITRRTRRTLARKLWIDAATGLALKRENYREDGALAVTAAFSDISFRVPLPRSLFSLERLARRPGVRRVEGPPSGERSLPLRSVAGQLGGAAVAPAFLRGYQLVSAAGSGAGPRVRLHLRYSDGLNLVSLFEQKRSQRGTPTRVPGAPRAVLVGRREGHVVRRSSVTMLNWDRDALNLTLMGEVEEATLQDLAAAADTAH